MESLFWCGDLLENRHLDDEEILGNSIKRCSVDLLQGGEVDRIGSGACTMAGFGIGYN